MVSVDDVHASGVGVWCQFRGDQRGRGDERSKVTIRGRSLPRGKYFAKILSGGVWVRTGAKPAISRQVEFEFDSHSDEGPGVTLISPTYTQNLVVLGLIREAKTSRLIGKFSTSCEFRPD
jgi:hypothetical protein